LRRSGGVLTNVTKISRAEKAISDIPLGFWINSRNLAKNACLGVQTMSRFLFKQGNED
jgi:hypothetical protein